MSQGKAPPNLYQAFFENSNDAGFLMLDDQIIQCNHRMVELYRADGMNEVIGLSINDLAPEFQPDGQLSRAKAETYIIRAIRGDVVPPFDWVGQRKDGTTFESNVSLSAVHCDEQSIIQITARDVTEERRVRRELTASEAKYRSLFKAAPIGIGMVKSRVITEVNDLICEMVGRSRDELIGQSSRVLYASDKEWERVGQEKYRLISELGTGTVETLWQHQDGRVIEVLLSSTPLDQDDWDLGVTFTALDITELHKMKERLQQTQKLEAVGQLAGGISHDFNNMLAGILGFAELMAEKLHDNPELSDYCSQITETAQRAAELPQQLLLYSQQGEYAPTPIDLHDSIRGAIVLLSHSIDKKIEILESLDSEESVILGDPSQLQSIFLNLGVNARDAMPEGGQVSIRTETVDLDADYCAESSFDIEPGRFVAIHVQDTGSGMDPELQSKIFEPFVTTKTETEGAGMGLAAVYGVVVSHHGEITVSSQPGQGTEFQIRFPIQRTEMETPVEEATEEIAPGHGTILVADDEPVIRTMAQAILTDLGYQVLLAENGYDAVWLFEQESDRIDAIILDVVMPKMGGLEAIEELRKIKPDVKVIISSGYSDDQRLAEFKKKDVTAFVKKPYRRATLAQAVQDILADKG